MVKNLPADVGDAGLIPRSGRFPREGKGNPLKCSCLENPRTEEPDRLQFMALQRDRTKRLSTCWTETFCLHYRCVLL